MTQGSLRVDVNVSVGDYGTPCELKNLISYKNIGHAIGKFLSCPFVMN